MSKRLGLTKKQDETRLRGLRILARMIVRAHLASLREAEAGQNGLLRRRDGPEGGRGVKCRQPHRG